MVGTVGGSLTPAARVAEVALAAPVLFHPSQDLIKTYRSRTKETGKTDRQRHMERERKEREGEEREGERGPVTKALPRLHRIFMNSCTRTAVLGLSSPTPKKKCTACSNQYLSSLVCNQTPTTASSHECPAFCFLHYEKGYLGSDGTSVQTPLAVCNPFHDLRSSRPGFIRVVWRTERFMILLRAQRVANVRGGLKYRGQVSLSG